MKILTAAQMKQVEAEAVRSGISWSRLMENAGAAFTKTLRDFLDVKDKSIVVVVGTGNNGGDGYVVARKLMEYGADVTMISAFGHPLTPQSQEMALKITASPLSFSLGAQHCINSIRSADIIIDAVFGIGYREEPNDTAAELFGVINSSPALKVAIDLPSGVEADGKYASSYAVKADITIALGALKPCHVLYKTNEYCGKILGCSIGIPVESYHLFPTAPETIDFMDVKQNIPKRSKNSHKGANGTAMLLCGSYGMAGAAILAAKSCLRSGAGLINVAAPHSIYPILAASLPEAVHTPLPQTVKGSVSLAGLGDILSSAKKATALCIGCGLNRSPEASELLKLITSSVHCPVILDADGINQAADCIDIIEHHSSPMIITPHPAEMARLWGVSANEVNADRLGYASKTADRFKVTVVLKGANTVVATPKGLTFANMNGNPGMATAGSGDCLAGIITALTAEGLSPESAACCGVYIHAAAGDFAAEQFGEISMCVEDMINMLPRVFKSF